MKMPYRCFICDSWHNDCGHREPELVEHYLGKAALLEEQSRIAQQRLWSLTYRNRLADKEYRRQRAAEQSEVPMRLEA